MEHSFRDASEIEGCTLSDTGVLVSDQSVTLFLLKQNNIIK